MKHKFTKARKITNFIYLSTRFWVNSSAYLTKKFTTKLAKSNKSLTTSLVNDNPIYNILIKKNRLKILSIVIKYSRRKFQNFKATKKYLAD